MISKFDNWFQQLTQYQKIHKQRCLIVLSGKLNWATELLSKTKFLEDDCEVKLIDKYSVFSDTFDFESSLTRLNYRNKLGTENAGVIFADTVFPIDALAALSGTIVAGGVMIVYLEKLDVDSLFIQRFIDRVKKIDGHYFVSQHAPLPALNIKRNSSSDHKTIDVDNAAIESGFTLNNEQLNAVSAIKKVKEGHRNRPLVLTADRGRGKSSALAIASAELIRDSHRVSGQPLNIIITAPNIQSVAIYFSQLTHCLKEIAQSNNFDDELIILKSSIHYGHSSVSFVAVDQLIASNEKVSLVLVDEAAGIPVYLLSLLLNKYRRIVFSSTVHGYEGAGRGFTLKFTKELDNQQPQWQKLHINEPIRWRTGDPLEKLTFDSCLLNAELAELPVGMSQAIKIEQLRFCIVSARELINNEALLANVFSILVTAHYQTSPSDLKQLFDNNKVSLAVLFNDEQVIAVCVLLAEGLCSLGNIEAIKNNQRRLKDQFLPQSLLTHCGIEKAFEFSYLRVMRLAVHPSVQNKGIGRYFIKQLDSYAAENKIDFIGASFGANSQLLKFWLQAEFKVARVGFNKDKASGEHSVLVLRAITGGASTNTELLNQINKEFYRSFDYLLVDEYQLLDSKLIWLILHFSSIDESSQLALSDQRAVADFASKLRLYSACLYGLHQWLLVHCQVEYHEDILVLIDRILKKQSIEKVCQSNGFTGKKQLNNFLIGYVSKAINSKEGSFDVCCN